MRVDSAQAAGAPTLPPFPPMNAFSASQLQAMRGMVMPFPPQQHMQSFMSAMQQQMAGAGGIMPPLHFPTMPSASAARPHNVPRPVVNAKPRGNCRGKWTPEEVRARARSPSALLSRVCPCKFFKMGTTLPRKLALAGFPQIQID